VNKGSGNCGFFVSRKHMETGHRRPTTTRRNNANGFARAGSTKRRGGHLVELELAMRSLRTLNGAIDPADIPVRRSSLGVRWT
jgi:hypothetical protein